MAEFIKHAGVWKEGQPYDKVGGIWKPRKEGLVRNAGVWKKAYTGNPEWVLTVGKSGSPYGNSDWYLGRRTLSSIGSINPSTPLDGYVLIDLYEENNNFVGFRKFHLKLSAPAYPAGKTLSIINGGVKKDILLRPSTWSGGNYILEDDDYDYHAGESSFNLPLTGSVIVTLSD